MRIVAGKFRGKNLVNSDHLKNLRPTTDKNREALFNILSSGKIVKEFGFKIIDANILDICCGSGAVAFEALSRGAKFACLVDKNPLHLEIVKQNISNLAVQELAEIICVDAAKLSESKMAFDLVFIDPPYADDYLRIIENLINKLWISEKSLIVVESKKSDKLAQKLENLNLLLLEERSYGKTVFGFFRLKNITG